MATGLSIICGLVIWRLDYRELPFMNVEGDVGKLGFMNGKMVDEGYGRVSGDGVRVCGS